MRIGFAVKVLGEGGIKECDARRWQNNPHLRCSVEMLHQVFDYCNRADIRMYRMSSDLAPYLTHPDLPQFHKQLEEAEEDLIALGKKAREYDLRLSLHPSQYIVLNAQDEAIAAKSIADLNAQAQILEIMGLDDNAVVITHVGGAYGDKAAGIERFARRYEQLPEVTRRRLVVENDDVTYSAGDALRVHELCGIRMVFDNLHHFCNNPRIDQSRATGQNRALNESESAGQNQPERKPSFHARSPGPRPGDVARRPDAENPLQFAAHRVAGGGAQKRQVRQDGDVRHAARKPPSLRLHQSDGVSVLSGKSAGPAPVRRDGGSEIERPGRLETEERPGEVRHGDLRRPSRRADKNNHGFQAARYAAQGNKSDSRNLHVGQEGKRAGQHAGC